MNIDIYDITGKNVSKIEFDIPSINVSDFELSQALRVYETNIHQGTKSAKTRGEVAYSKRKPWRQKGTGRARAGTRGSPIWVGGGVAHAPKPYQRRLHLNKKQKQRVFTYLIKELFNKVKVVGLQTEGIDTIVKTKTAKEFMKKIGLLPFNTFFITPVKDNLVYKGFNNLKHVFVKRAELLNPRDLMRGYHIVITVPAIEIIKSRLWTND